LTVLDTLYAIEIRGEIALSSSKSLYDALKPTLAASFLENKISASVKNAPIVALYPLDRTYSRCKFFIKFGEIITSKRQFKIIRNSFLVLASNVRHFRRY
jgi:hypothetical protein